MLGLSVGILCVRHDGGQRRADRAANELAKLGAESTVHNTHTSRIEFAIIIPQQRVKVHNKSIVQKCTIKCEKMSESTIEPEMRKI